MFPAHLDDFIDEDNPIRAVDVFVDLLGLRVLGFTAVDPSSTGRPGYHPSVLLKLCIYGYLHRVPSSRRLEREAGCNVELMWLTGRLAPDHKTIADFRKDYGPAIQRVCAQFAVLCRDLGLFKHGLVAIDGSKFKAVNSRDNNFTRTKIAKRIEQSETHIKRYLTALERVDRQADGAFKQGRFAIQDFRYDPAHDRYICPAGQHLTKGKARSDRRPNAETYHYRNLTACVCPLKSRCTPDKVKRVKRWIHEEVLDAMQERLDQMPNAMKIRRQTAEHPFGTIKAWMGATHFLTKTLKNVKTETSLQVLAYNQKRMIAIFGVRPLIKAVIA